MFTKFHTSNNKNNYYSLKRLTKMSEMPFMYSVLVYIYISCTVSVLVYISFLACGFIIGKLGVNKIFLSTLLNRINNTKCTYRRLTEIFVFLYEQNNDMDVISIVLDLNGI